MWNHLFQGMQTPPCMMTIFRRQGDSIYSRCRCGVGPCAHPEPQNLDDPLVLWLSLGDSNATRRCNTLCVCVGLMIWKVILSGDGCNIKWILLFFYMYLDWSGWKYTLPLHYFVSKWQLQWARRLLFYCWFKQIVVAVSNWMIKPNLGRIIRFP